MRDLLHVDDAWALLRAQMERWDAVKGTTVNAGGGAAVDFGGGGDTLLFSDLWGIQGQLYDGKVQTPVTADRLTYSRKVPWETSHHEAGHGRDIVWTLRAMPAPDWVIEQWPGSATIISVRSQGIRDGRPVDETRYYVGLPEKGSSRPIRKSAEFARVAACPFMPDWTEHSDTPIATPWLVDRPGEGRART